MYFDEFNVWPRVFSYLDDLVGAMHTKALAESVLKHITETFNALEFYVKDAKTRFPKMLNIVLGLEYNVRFNWIRLSQEKADKYLVALHQVLFGSWSKKLFESISGKLVYASLTVSHLRSSCPLYINGYISLSVGDVLSPCPTLKSWAFRCGNLL